MRSKRRGSSPCPIRQVLAGASLAGLLVILPGCANDRGATYSSAPAMNMAGVRVETEADGLPAQLAPRERAPMTDDPREPWSPNYGSVRPIRTSTTTETVAVADAPFARAIPVPHTGPVDAEDVIRRAVATHEMRKGN